jgi:hypothetical protein
MVLMISPFLIQRPRRNFRIECSNHALKYLKTILQCHSDPAIA